MEKKKHTEPKQKRSIATKNRIKKTAKKLFSKKGYHKVTSNRIAAEAKVPIGSFYNYFKNKKILLLELISDLNEKYHVDTIDEFTKIAATITSKEIALQVMEALIHKSIFSSSVNQPFLKIIHSLQFTDPDVLAFSEEIRKIEIKTIIHFVEIVHQFHPQKNIPIKAKLMHSSIENVSLYINQLGTDCNHEQLVAETIEMLSQYLFKEEKPI